MFEFLCGCYGVAR